MVLKKLIIHIKMEFGRNVLYYLILLVLLDECVLSCMFILIDDEFELVRRVRSELQ